MGVAAGYHSERCIKLPLTLIVATVFACEMFIINH